MGEAISRSDCALQTPHHLSYSDLGRAQNAGPTESAPLRTTQVPEPEQLDLGGACTPGPASDGSWWSNLEPEQCGQGGYLHREQGQAQCGWGTVSTRQCYLFPASLPPPQRDWISEPKKSVHHRPLCVRVEIRQWRDQQTEEAKTEGTALEVTGAID